MTSHSPALLQAAVRVPIMQMPPPPYSPAPTSSTTAQSTVRGHEPGVWEVIITQHGCIAHVDSAEPLKETNSFVVCDGIDRHCSSTKGTELFDAI